MKKRINKMEFLSLRGATLIGLGLLIIGLAAFLVLGPDLVLGQENAKGGKPEKPPGKGKPGLYRVYMSTSPDATGIDTDLGCNEQGYVLAEWDDAHNFLHANGTLIDTELSARIPLLMRLLTDLEWTRKYDAGKGLSGVFNGCYGGTGYYHGALFITFKKKRKKTYISFNWHFDYFATSDVREHFTLISEDIPFQKWTGEGISGPVEGWFDLQYYLNDPDEFIGYESLTDGLGLDFDFYITIEKITQ